MSKRNARSMREAGRGGISVSDLPPCHWLPLFAHSVNYYQKAVYIGCSPTLLHILWPIIKGDLHYKPWSPSKKSIASFCFKTYPSTIWALPPDLSVSLSSSHSSNSLAWTRTCWLNCAWQAPHPLALLFTVPFMFALIFFGAVTVQQLSVLPICLWLKLLFVCNYTVSIFKKATHELLFIISSEFQMKVFRQLKHLAIVTNRVVAIDYVDYWFIFYLFFN